MHQNYVIGRLRACSALLRDAQGRRMAHADRPLYADFRTYKLSRPHLFLAGLIPEAV